MAFHLTVAHACNIEGLLIYEITQPHLLKDYLSLAKATEYSGQLPFLTVCFAFITSCFEFNSRLHQYSALLRCCLGVVVADYITAVFTIRKTFSKDS